MGHGAYAEEVSTDSEKVVMFTVNATWLRRHPVYSVYYVMVRSLVIYQELINISRLETS